MKHTVFSHPSVWLSSDLRIPQGLNACGIVMTVVFRGALKKACLLVICSDQIRTHVVT